MIRLALVRALVAGRAPGPGHLHRCFLGTHRRKVKPELLDLPDQAREFVYGLSPATRVCLLKELQNFQSSGEGNGPYTVIFCVCVCVCVFASLVSQQTSKPTLSPYESIILP